MSKQTEGKTAETWVTAKEVARACGLQTKTIYQYVQTVPGFPTIRIGSRTLRFVVADVQAFLRSNADRFAWAAGQRPKPPPSAKKPRRARKEWGSGSPTP